MATLGNDYCTGRGHTNIVESFGDAFLDLDYQHNNFNDPDAMTVWKGLGLHPREGVMYDMSRPKPNWLNEELLQKDFPWEHLGWSFYRMRPGDFLPNHVDQFVRFKEKFDTSNKTIIRAVVMLENWKSGHYLELARRPVVNWHAGEYFWWTERGPHMAANLGLEHRYTLQLTGLIEL